MKNSQVKLIQSEIGIKQFPPVLLSNIKRKLGWVVLLMLKSLFALYIMETENKNGRGCTDDQKNTVC